MPKQCRNRRESLEQKVEAVLVKFVTPTTVTAAMTLATAILVVAQKVPLKVEKIVPLKAEQVAAVEKPAEKVNP